MRCRSGGETAVRGSLRLERTSRTLTICNIDTMAYKLLLPWLRGLRAAGCAVIVACRCGAYADRLRAEEFTPHHVPMRREAKNPFAHLPARGAHPVVAEPGV